MLYAAFSFLNGGKLIRCTVVYVRDYLDSKTLANNGIVDNLKKRRNKCNNERNGAGYHAFRLGKGLLRD